MSAPLETLDLICALNVGTVDANKRQLHILLKHSKLAT